MSYVPGAPSSDHHRGCCDGSANPNFIEDQWSPKLDADEVGASSRGFPNWAVEAGTEGGRGCLNGGRWIEVEGTSVCEGNWKWRFSCSGCSLRGVVSRMPSSVFVRRILELD
jgi:hypothetical protein